MNFTEERKKYGLNVKQVSDLSGIEMSVLYRLDKKSVKTMPLTICKVRYFFIGYKAALGRFKKILDQT